MHESQMSLHCGSLTSGQPIVRNTYQQPAPASGQQPNNLACTFCGVKFPNDAGLRVHEVRCSSKKEQLTVSFSAFSLLRTNQQFCSSNLFFEQIAAFFLNKTL